MIKDTLQPWGLVKLLPTPSTLSPVFIWTCFQYNQSYNACLNRFRWNPHLSGEQHGSVIVLQVPLAWWIEKLLPGAEVSQSNASVAGDLRSHLLIFHHQHFHHHQVHWVLYAGVLVQLGSHGHEGKNVVLWVANMLQLLRMNNKQFLL